MPLFYRLPARFRQPATLVCLLAFAACARAPFDARPHVEKATRLLASADSAEAYRVVQEAVLKAPDDLDLRRLHLRLGLAGFGTRDMPLETKGHHLGNAARAILAHAPQDTLALRVLVDDALQMAARWHDRVALTEINPFGQEFVSAEEIRARSARSAFDLAQRERLAPMLDQRVFARRAHEHALGYIATWLAVDPGAVRAHEAAVTLAALTRNWAGVLDLAQRMRVMTGQASAGMYVGLAHYQLGNVEVAGATFERAMQELPPARRARYEDVRPLLRRDQWAVYDAAPDRVRDAFWADADPRLLTSLNERRVEHIARVVEADLILGGGPLGSLRPGAVSGGGTQEGDIWIRYGRPTTHSWRVNGPGARAIRVWDYDGFRFVFSDAELSGEFSLYSSGEDKDDYVLQNRNMQHSDPSRTQIIAERPLEIPALASRFRAPGGGMDIVVGFGVPVAEVAVPVQTGAFARIGPAVVSRAEREHQRLGRERVTERGGSAVWAEAAQVSLPAAGEVRVEVEAFEGKARGSATIPIDRLAAGFGVSDVLLAHSLDYDGEGPVVRNGIGIVPAPRAVFPVEGPLYLYLEAYGLAVSEDRLSRYEVETDLRPARRGGLIGRVFPRGRRGVSVQTEGMGSADVPISFLLDPTGAQPGEYVLTVRVADTLAETTATAQRSITLE